MGYVGGIGFGFRIIMVIVCYSYIGSYTYKLLVASKVFGI